MYSMNTTWLREDSLFMAVDSQARLLLARLISTSAASMSGTATWMVLQVCVSVFAFTYFNVCVCFTSAACSMVSL
jgi:hypothetical protein